MSWACVCASVLIIFHTWGVCSSGTHQAQNCCVPTVFTPGWQAKLSGTRVRPRPMPHGSHMAAWHTNTTPSLLHCALQLPPPPPPLFPPPPGAAQCTFNAAPTVSASTTAAPPLLLHPPLPTRFLRRFRNAQACRRRQAGGRQAVKRHGQAGGQAGRQADRQAGG